MKLLADEGVDRAVVERLRRDGHDVLYLAELSPGTTDEEVLQQANDRGALLLTADKDFGELVFRQGRAHPGVVLLRLAGLSNVTKAEIVAEVCQERAPELLQAFSVVSPGQVAYVAPWNQAPNLPLLRPQGAGLDLASQPAERNRSVPGSVVP